MAMVFDILEEERRRLVSLKERYKQQLSELPRGSISLKKRRNRDYLYLAYRESGKVKFDYVGPVESEAAKKAASNVQQRKEIEEKINKVEQNLIEVERGLRGKH